MSPRPRSSSPKTSFSLASAGASPWTCSTAPRISSAVEATLDLVTLEELPPDHHLLDLGGPLADQKQRRVAVDALDLVLLRVAVAAVDAKRLLGVGARGLGGKQLRHPRLEVGALARVLQSRRLHRQEPRGLDARAHLGELEGD